MDDMNDLGSCELKALDLMNYWEMWMMWMILHPELNHLDVMNRSSYGWHERLRVVNNMNDYSSCDRAFRFYEQHRAVVDKKGRGW